MTSIQRPKMKRWLPPNDAASRTAALSCSCADPVVLSSLSKCWPCFEDLPAPRAGDWLAKGQAGEKDRPGQTMKTYTRPGPHRAFPSERAKTILLVPLGDTTGAPPVDTLVASLAATYYGLTVVVAPPKLLPKKERENLSCEDYGGEFGPQYLTNEVHELLTKHKPRYSFVIVAYTMQDITKQDRVTGDVWNFVFGEADVSRGTGVFSFSRYGAAAADPSLFARRCCMVLCHEVGHLFGIKHCVYAMCLMNGSNSLREAESRPFALFPVDLAKVADTLARSRLMHTKKDNDGGGGGGGGGGGDNNRAAFLAEREAALLAFFQRESMHEDAVQAQQRLALLQQRATKESAAAAGTGKSAAGGGTGRRTKGEGGGRGRGRGDGGRDMRLRTKKGAGGVGGGRVVATTKPTKCMVGDARGTSAAGWR